MGKEYMGMMRNTFLINTDFLVNELVLFDLFAAKKYFLANFL